MNVLQPKIGYIGWVGYGNLGDDALFVAFQKLFSDCVSLPYKETTKIQTYERVVRKKVYQAVSLGGGTLINNGSFYEIFRSAQKKGRPTFVFGAGVRSPSYWNRITGAKNSLAEWIECLHKAVFTGVRGPFSQELLERQGFNKAEVIGDLALSLAKPEVNRKPHEKRIGINIGVSNGLIWGGDEQAVLDLMTEFLNTMLDRNWQVTFFPVWHKDLPYIRKAASRLKKPVKILKNYLSIENVFEYLDQCDIVIGEKLHSVILAMAAYTPSIMLEYRPKCADYMASMDLSEFNMRTDQLDLDKLIDLVEKLYADLDGYQDFIAQKVKRYKQLQQEKSKWVLNKILNE